MDRILSGTGGQERRVLDGGHVQRNPDFRRSARLGSVSLKVNALRTLKVKRSLPSLFAICLIKCSIDSYSPLDTRTPTTPQKLLVWTLGTIAVSSLIGSTIFMIYLVAWMRRRRLHYASLNPSLWPTEKPADHPGISPELELVTLNSGCVVEPNHDAGGLSKEHQRIGGDKNAREIERLLARFPLERLKSN